MHGYTILANFRYSSRVLCVAQEHTKYLCGLTVLIFTWVQYHCHQLVTYIRLGNELKDRSGIDVYLSYRSALYRYCSCVIASLYFHFSAWRPYFLIPWICPNYMHSSVSYQWTSYSLSPYLYLFINLTPSKVTLQLCHKRLINNKLGSRLHWMSTCLPLSSVIIRPTSVADAGYLEGFFCCNVAISRGETFEATPTSD